MPKSKRRKKSTRNKTGYFGVTKTSSGKFQAIIHIDNKPKYLGSYDTARQAANAYDKEAFKLRRPLSKFNDPTKAPVGYTPIQQALHYTNTVGYRGVYKNRTKFRAMINIAGKFTHVGNYDTTKEAAIAYDRAVLKANQSASLLNFPDMIHNLDVEPENKNTKRSSSTGYKGTQKRPNGKFRAEMRTNGKRETLGTFNTVEQAAVAYDRSTLKNNLSTTLHFTQSATYDLIDRNFFFLDYTDNHQCPSCDFTCPDLNTMKHHTPLHTTTFSNTCAFCEFRTDIELLKPYTDTSITHPLNGSSSSSSTSTSTSITTRCQDISFHGFVIKNADACQRRLAAIKVEVASPSGRTYHIINHLEKNSKGDIAITNDKFFHSPAIANAWKKKEKKN